MTNTNIDSATAFSVTLKGNKIEPELVSAWSVEQDIGQPDMCTVTLRNEDHAFSDSYRAGDEIVITAGDGDHKVFSGELIGMEPVYRANGENVIIARGFNLLHRLTRAKKSKTYVKLTDEEIVSQVATRSNLNPKCGKADMRHDHVYQNNQTDLEFLRLRASRLGFSVWVDGSDLYFDSPSAQFDSEIVLQYSDAESCAEAKAIFLRSFTPKLSSARLLKEVEVRGWDPVNKKEIIAVGKAQPSSLGNKPAHEAAVLPDGEVKSFNVSQPIYTQEEAQKLADAKIAAANMSYITGSGECRGAPKVRPGVVIKINVNLDKPGDRFNGKYMVVGASHRYSSKGSGGRRGYVTGFRVSRDAEGG